MGLSKNLNKNDDIEITIDDMGTDGEGIGHYEGFTFFVKDAVIGDKVRAKIMKMKKNYGYARLEEVLAPSNKRGEPKCDFYRQCGGCQLQALSYEEQLKFKENKIINNLKRIGGFTEIPSMPVIGMEEPYFYRNKAQFPIGMDKNNNPIAGFYAGRTHSIIPNTDCSLGVPENRKILETILDFMKKYKISAYDEKTTTGTVRHVLIRKGFTTGEIMVCVVINSKKLPNCDKLVEKLCKLEGMNITSISLNINQKNTNVILGEKLISLYGPLYIHDYIGNICFQISPLSFYQVNPVQTKKLYDKVLEFADFKGNEVVWDLYCGIGTISLYMAEHVREVYGVEIVPQAIEDAKNNAKANNIKNASFYVGKAEEVVPELYKKEGIHADVIVVDPPRKGCDQTLLNTIIEMAPERLVYVSCDSATLARDLKYLCERGFKLEKVQGVDQFGQTVHVETVVKLSLKKDTPKIEVTMEPEEESNYTPQEKATYSKIKEYVKDKYGVNVHTSYIAQVKRMCGLDMGENYNKSKKENPEVKQCPQEKVEYIKDALRYFGVLQ